MLLLLHLDVKRASSSKKKFPAKKEHQQEGHAINLLLVGKEGSRQGGQNLQATEGVLRSKASMAPPSRQLFWPTLSFVCPATPSMVVALWGHQSSLFFLTHPSLPAVSMHGRCRLKGWGTCFSSVPQSPVSVTQGKKFLLVAISPSFPQ